MRSFCAWRNSRLHDVTVPTLQVVLVAVLLHLFGLVLWASITFAFVGAIVLFNAMAILDFVFQRLKRGDDR
jgi:hypothetical protein